MRTVLFVVLTFACELTIAAPPIAGPDCGIGATVVGSKEAGKVTIGADGDVNLCTLTGFSWPKVPSCSATCETCPNGPQPYGTVSTKTSLVLVYPPFALDDMQPGYIISYLCVGQ